MGDVIYVEAATGQVRRVGRSEEFAGQFDLEADKYVPVPKGDVHKKKEVVQVIEPVNTKPSWRTMFLFRKRYYKVYRKECGGRSHAKSSCQSLATVPDLCIFDLAGCDAA